MLQAYNIPRHGCSAHSAQCSALRAAQQLTMSDLVLQTARLLWQ
jgi:hypothetical protein